MSLVASDLALSLSSFFFLSYPTFLLTCMVSDFFAFFRSRTTTPLTQVTDTPDPATGLIDGVLPLSSVPVPTLKEGKVAILVTAKKYIDHLDKERRRTERARKGLEEFVKKIEGGREALKGWREVSLI